MDAPSFLTIVQDRGAADFSITSQYLNDPEFAIDYLRDAMALMYFGKHSNLRIYYPFELNIFSKGAVDTVCTVATTSIRQFN
jgi:hypothetical protein